jgi:hypothetical protein
MTISPSVTARLESAEAIRPQQFCELLTITPQTSILFELITGLDMFRNSTLDGGNTLSKLKSLAMKGQWETFNAMNIPMPKGIEVTDKKSIILTRAPKISRYYYFKTGVNYTAANIALNPNNFEFQIAAKGELIPEGYKLSFPTDTAGEIVQCIVNSVIPTGDGGARIFVKITTGTVVGDITNSTAKALTPLGTFQGEGTTVKKRKYETATTEEYLFGKVQSSITITDEGGKTKFDAKGQPLIPVKDLINMEAEMVTSWANALLLAVKESNKLDSEGNPYNVPEGLMNRAGVEAYDLTSTKLGMPALNRCGRDLVYDSSSKQVKWDRIDGKPVVELLCDRVRANMFDQFKKAHQNTSFGALTVVTPENKKYSIQTDLIETRDCFFRIHHERLLDDYAVPNKMVAFNKNNLVPATQEGFWFNTKLVPALTDGNNYVYSSTLRYTLAYLLNEQIKFFTNVNALEGS